jgi:predicted DsbA family dithiol-disulfide isomerase
VAERSSLVRLRAEFELDVEWVGYELHPETPPGGVPLAEWLPQPEAMMGYVRTFAADFGVGDLVHPKLLANTRRAHASAQAAREAGRLEPWRAAAFDAYWRKRRGLESDDDLAAIARDAGIDPALAVRAASDPAAVAQVDAARQLALRAGVTGVPTFDVGGARVVGCQRYEVLVETVRRAGARRRG